MPSSTVSNALAAETANGKKRTYEELGNYDDDNDNDGDGDDSDKNSVSGLAAFFHYAWAHHKQVRTVLMGCNSNDPTAKSKTMAANVTFGKVAEELANKYKALPATMIAVYQEEAAKSNVDFVKEMKPFSVPTKTTKKKHPDAPKGPVSSFFHYMMATRTKISGENPDMGFGAVTKECAVRFKDLTDKDRKQWEEKAAADKVRYKEQMEVFEKEQEAKKKIQENTEDENEDDHEEAEKPNKKSKKNPAQEQEKEKAQENAGNEKDDSAKEADKPKKKNKRKSLTGEQKTQEKEDNKPNKAKKSHTKEHDKGEAHESAGNEKDDTPKEANKPTKKSKRKSLTGEQKTEEKEADHTKAEKPKKREKRPADAPTWYKSGYILYMEANRQTIQKDNPGMVHSEVSKLGSTNFKALSHFDQQMWTVQATADKARFDREMEVYNSKQEGTKKDEECMI